MADVPYSNTYRHKLKELTKQFLAGDLSEEEFNKKKDELAEEEVKLHETSALVFVRKALKPVESEVEMEVKGEVARQEETKRWHDLFEQEKLKKIQEDERRRAEAELRKMLSYREEVEDYLSERRTKVKWMKRGHMALQFTIIVASSFTASLAGTDIPRAWIIGFGIISALSGSISAYLRLQDKIYGSEKSIAEIESRCRNYDQGVGDYQEKDARERYILLRNEVTAIQNQTLFQEVEYWAPTQKKAETKEKEES